MDNPNRIIRNKILVMGNRSKDIQTTKASRNNTSEIPIHNRVTNHHSNSPTDKHQMVTFHHHRDIQITMNNHIPNVPQSFVDMTKEQIDYYKASKEDPEDDLPF